MVADIIQAVRAGAVRRRWRRIEGGDDAADNVVDIGEVALHVAVIEDADRLVGKNGAGEDIERHIGPPPRPVDGEKAQPGLGHGV